VDFPSQIRSLLYFLYMTYTISISPYSCFVWLARPSITPTRSVGLS